MAKLLVASGIFHPEPGGPSTYLRALLPALQEMGWQIRVLTYGDSQPQPYPYPVTRIARNSYARRRLSYGLAARKQLAWADLVFAQTIDLPLWGGGRTPGAIKIVGDQAWERCVRKSWIEREMTVDDFQRRQGDARVRWQKHSRSRQVAAMDAVIVPSQYLKRMVTSWGVEAAKVHVIYNALPPAPRPALPRAQLRAELGFGERPTLLTVARLQPWKGVDHLIEAISDMPEVRLVIVGAGPDRHRLQELARPLGKRVQFTGQLARENVQRYMVAADGLALYSGYEGLSHTLLESLQLGTPVLASAIGGNAEIVRHGVNGILAPHVDIDALRRGIKELIEGRDDYAAGGRTGLERFSFERMAQDTDRLLRSLLP